MVDVDSTYFAELVAEHALYKKIVKKLAVEPDTTTIKEFRNKVMEK